MTQLTLDVVANGYTVTEPEQIHYQALEGGMGRYTLDMVGGANRLVNVTWVCSGDEYEYLNEFFRTNVGLDCPPFEIMLLIDGSAPAVLYDGVQFVEDSFKLASVSAGVFTVTAQLEVPPLTDVETWFDAGWDEVWPDTPRKLNLHPQQSNYSMDFGSEIVSTNQGGPQGSYRRSYLNAARRVTVKWLTESAGYGYLQTCYRSFVSSGGEPFLIDLLLDSQDVTEHRACFVPGSFSLSEQKGDAYTIDAVLEVEPAPYVGDFVQHPSVLPTGGGLIGWFEPDNPSYGVATEGASGSRSIEDGPFPSSQDLYLGVVGWIDETVVWDLDWVTTSFSGFDPTLTDLGGGKAMLSWVNIDYPFNRGYDAGVATITATVNGSPSNAIEAVMASQFYGNLVWGPVSP